MKVTAGGTPSPPRPLEDPLSVSRRPAPPRGPAALAQEDGEPLDPAPGSAAPPPEERLAQGK